MSSERTVAELLAALAAVMAERGLRWYLFGAQAAIIWGSPRLSADADITAQLAPEEVEPFLETMRRHGFHVVISDSDFATSSTRYSKNGMRALSGDPRSAMSTATPSSPFQREFVRSAVDDALAAAWLASWRARLSQSVAPVCL